MKGQDLLATMQPGPTGSSTAMGAVPGPSTLPSSSNAPSLCTPAATSLMNASMVRGSSMTQSPTPVFGVQASVPVAGTMMGQGSMPDADGKLDAIATGSEAAGMTVAPGSTSMARKSKWTKSPTGGPPTCRPKGYPIDDSVVRDGRSLRVSGVRQQERPSLPVEAALDSQGGTEWKTTSELWSPMLTSSWTTVGKSSKTSFLQPCMMEVYYSLILLFCDSTSLLLYYSLTLLIFDSTIVLLY